MHVLLAVPWQLCENLAVKVPGCSHLWHWAFGEGEKTVAEAEQLIDHDLLVYAFYSTLKQEFDVSVRGNSGLLVWVFRDFYNSYLYAYFK